MSNCVQAKQRHRWSIIDLQQVIKMRKKGYRFKSIAVKFDITANAVRKALSRFLNKKLAILNVYQKQTVHCINTCDLRQLASRNCIKFDEDSSNTKLLYDVNKIMQLKYLNPRRILI